MEEEDVVEANFKAEEEEGLALQAREQCPQGNASFILMLLDQNSSQSLTYDTVKDHITQCMQKNHKNGIDIAESLNKEVMKDTSTLQPARKISTNSDQALKTLEQDGFDIDHKVHIQKHLKQA